MFSSWSRPVYNCYVLLTLCVLFVYVCVNYSGGDELRRGGSLAVESDVPDADDSVFVPHRRRGEHHY